MTDDVSIDAIDRFGVGGFVATSMTFVVMAMQKVVAEPSLYERPHQKADDADMPEVAFH